MKRKLFTACSAASLLLFILSAVACAVSYVTPFGFESARTWLASRHGEFAAASDTTITVNGGTLYLQRMYMTSAGQTPKAPGVNIRWFGTHVAGDCLRTRWLPSYSRNVSDGVVVGRYWATVGGKTERQGSFPLCVLVPAFTILPIHWLTLRRREKHRNAAAFCVACGYDLRASRERCPECGARVPASSEAPR